MDSRGGSRTAPTGGGNPDMVAVVLIVFWGIVSYAFYCAGVREGRRQVTMEYAAEIRRLDVATRPEQVKAWLKGGK